MTERSPLIALFGEEMKHHLVHPVVKWGCIASILVVVVLIAGVFMLDRLIPSTARSQLPASATDIQEYYSDSWNGDFVRLIKAKLPQETYAEYARRLKIVTLFDPATDQDIESVINLVIADAPTWWNPPKASETTYFEHRKGDDYLQVLSYSNGYVYYLVTSW
jgi:hypothetical protein